MNWIVCVLIAVFTNGVAIAGELWYHGHSPTYYGGPSRYHFPSFDAYANHIRAKYHAQKAHDLAKLKSSIYGIGHGLYGFRYGSHFPRHFSKPFPLLPFMTKYPIFLEGFHHYPTSYIPDHFFFDHHYPSISGHLFGGFGYPSSYHNSYSHGYSYGKGYSWGKGYSHGHKHSHGYSQPHYGHYGYPGPHSPLYVKKEFPGETVVYKSGHDPHSHGYEYAWVKETPDYPSHHHSVLGKFPAESIAYEEVPVKSTDYVLVPSSEIAFAGDVHQGDKYAPEYELKHEKFVDRKPDGDYHSLNLQSSLHDFKSNDNDFVAYGSEKSETKQSKED